MDVYPSWWLVSFITSPLYYLQVCWGRGWKTKCVPSPPPFSSSPSPPRCKSRRWSTSLWSRGPLPLVQILTSQQRLRRWRGVKSERVLLGFHWLAVAWLKEEKRNCPICVILIFPASQLLWTLNEEKTMKAMWLLQEVNYIWPHIWVKLVWVCCVVILATRRFLRHAERHLDTITSVLT